MTEPGQEAALQFLRPAQGQCFLVRDRGLLSLKRQLQGPGRVVEQGSRIGRRRPGLPACHQRSVATRGGERHGYQLATVAARAVHGDIGAARLLEHAAGDRDQLAAGLARPSGRWPPRCPHLCLPVRRADDQGRLVSLKAPAQRRQRHPEALADRQRSGQRLEHLPDRFQYPVARGDLIQQPVTLDRTGRVARIQGGEIKIVALRRAGDGAEDRDDAHQATRAQHRYRP